MQSPILSLQKPIRKKYTTFEHDQLCALGYQLGRIFLKIPLLDVHAQLFDQRFLFVCELSKILGTRGCNVTRVVVYINLTVVNEEKIH